MERSMSESSERGEADSMTPVEKKKMIKELTDAGMYENNMSLADMINIFKCIRESADMAKPSCQGNVTNQSPEPQQQVSKPNYSQMVNANSSNLSQRGSTSLEHSKQQNYSFSQEKREDSPSESLYSPAPRQKARNPYHVESKEAQMNINKNRHSTNENLFEPANETKRVTRMNSQRTNEDKFPKWKVNVFDFVTPDNDIPLNSRFSSEPDINIVKTSIDIDEAIAQMSLHLQKVSDKMRSQRRNAVQSNSPWGQTIKEGTANGSLDKIPIMEKPMVEAEPPDVMNDNAVAEALGGRRRRTCVNKLPNHAYDEVEDNSDDDFVIDQKKKKPSKIQDKPEVPNHPLESNININTENPRRRRHSSRNDDGEYHFGEDIMDDSDEEKNVTKRKKPKISNAKKATASRTTRMKSVEPVSNDELENDSREKKNLTPIFIDDSDEVTICENAGTAGQSRDTKKKSNPVEATSSTSSTYPRRIPPPIPRGGKYSGVRSRKPLHPNATQVNKQKKQDNEDDAEVARTLSRSRSNVELQDEEIAAILENDVEETEAPSSSNSSISTRTRPSSRLRMQAELLRAQKKKEEEAELLLRHIEMQKEEEIAQKKQKVVRQRLQEYAEKTKAEELENKRKLAVENKYREVMRAREKQRQADRTELNPEGRRNNSDLANVPEDDIGMDQPDVELLDNEVPSNSSQTKKLPCPICRKKFLVTDIEGHAASCEEYDAGSSAGGSGSNSPVIAIASKVQKQRDAFFKLFACQICDNFTARNGKEFENHVQHCLDRKKNGVDDGSGSMVTVPDSPIRTFRTNSQQTDSEINYNQFVPRTRSTLTSFKRKRN